MGVFDGNIFDANVFDVEAAASAVTKGFPAYHQARRRKKRKSQDEEREELRRTIREAFDGKPQPEEIPLPPVLPYTLPARPDLVGPYREQLAARALVAKRKRDEEAIVLLLAA